MRFIDLFAGLGGFHLALQQLGHECVFASEIDKELIRLYEQNFDMPVAGDIRLISPENIPPHEILCAGFPCQPFSKAGERKGLDCTKWGELFWQITKVIDYHHPEFVFLENVSNLEKHDKGQTWQQMKKALTDKGYDVKYTHFSPDEFGMPQVRKRMFIVARRGSLGNFEFPQKQNTEVSIRTILDKKPPVEKSMPPHFLDCIGVWQEFIDKFPKDEALPTFPIWAMEFGATYPYEETNPALCSLEELKPYKGSFGISLEAAIEDTLGNYLPHHALNQNFQFEGWKVRYIQKNRELYLRHYRWLDKWIPKIQKFPHSLQKLEWNCKGAERDIWKKILQFRPSGVRVKLPTTAPSLNTIDTQMPIIGWEGRFITIKECARLHGMYDIQLPNLVTVATRALGNAVNVEIVKLIAENLLNFEKADTASYALEPFGYTISK